METMERTKPKARKKAATQKPENDKSANHNELAQSPMIHATNIPTKLEAGPSHNCTEIDETSKSFQNLSIVQQVREDFNQSSLEIKESAPPLELLITSVIPDVTMTYHQLNAELSIQKQKIPEIECGTRMQLNNALKPLSEDQLAALYVNTELELLHSFTSDFINAELKGSALKQHPLYELLMTYLQARRNLQLARREIDELKESCNHLQKNLWHIESVAERKSGMCVDGNIVYATYTFNKATFNHNNFKRVNRDQTKILEVISQSHVFYSYLIQVSKLQIDCFVQNIVISVLNASDLNKNSDVVLSTQNPPQHVEQHLKDLRLCVSILFQFQRKFIPDKEFVKEIRVWLERFLVVLLRLATWQDHLFILNHVLRCPPGVGSWAAKFIQVPLNAGSLQSEFEMNHIVTLLATILMPIGKREQFLDEMQQQPDIVEALWVVVDSDGEDDEVLGTSLKENDLVSLLNQLPLKKFFQYVLRYDDSNKVIFDANQTIKLFALLTRIVKILQNGLETYNQERYLQLCKRLSRFVRHIVQYATDHLDLYYHTLHEGNSLELTRLQVEYDAFFIRAFYCMYTSKKSGTWQFLAILPFDFVRSSTLWRIFYFLHDFDHTEDNLLDLCKHCDFQTKLWTISFRNSFDEHLTTMAEDECYYFLSTIANMAQHRNVDDLEFIKSAMLDLLHIGFISEATQETCSKNARILLTHITSKFPALLSDLFVAIYANIAQIGALALYLYEELPISVWKLSEVDLSLIENLVFQNTSATNESKLGRMIISRLNWDFDETGNLFVAYEFHCAVAALIVRAVEEDPAYVNWAWQTSVRLHLHISDRGIRSFEQVKEIEYFSAIHKGVRNQQPLAAFLSVLISSWGHLIPLICTKGFDQLIFLQTHQKHEAVLFALNLIVPLFLNCQENVINLDKFQALLVGLLNADRTYINMAKALMVTQHTILEQFGNMIRSQIVSYPLHQLPSPRCMVRLWIDSLVSIANWNRDYGVMYLIDVIIQSSLCYSDAMEAIVDTLKDLIQAATPQEQSTSLTSLFKWAASGVSNQGNLLINSSLSTYPYLALIMIDVEHEEREMATNLWPELLLTIKAQKGKVNVDAAIKKTTSKMKLQNFASGSLCIFRWAQQALDISVDHPIGVLFWQKFFTLFLYHVTTAPDLSVCVGEKFFEGVINFNFLKRLKHKLQECVDFYMAKMAQPDFQHLAGELQLYYQRVFNVFNAFSLWLEEPRLREPSFYVPGVPPHYEPQLLSLVLQGNSQLWLDYVNFTMMQETQTCCIRAWNQANFREKKNINKPLPQSNAGGTDPWQRIKCRLDSYDTPQAISSIDIGEIIIPQFDFNDDKVLKRAIERQCEQLTKSAHNFYLDSSNHKALNRQFENLVVKLYISVTNSKVKHVACSKSKSVQCSGAATISLNVMESKVNETVATRLDEYYSEREAFLTTRLQSAPVELCYASVLLQHIISMLVDRKLNRVDYSCAFGVELFYHILSLIKDETLNYCPTKKLFTECLERLGQSHIYGQEEETPQLLDKIMKEPNMGVYLAPHFSPVHVGTANFLMMYSMISKGLQQNYDLLYSLLSKFDVNRWLQRNNPKLSQRSQFIELVIRVLAEMGPEPGVEAQPLHELFRNHLIAIFQHEFPEHYGEILVHMIKASTGAEADCIAVNVWLDILSILATPKKITLAANMRDQIRCFAQSQTLLNYQVLMETAQMLAQHYTNERLQYGLYGLYPKNSNYVEVLAVFVGMIGHAFIISALNTHQGYLGEKMCEIIWPHLSEMFAPWIVPYCSNNLKENMANWIQQLTDDRSVILPWIPASAPFAQKMVNTLFECILFVIQTLPASNNIISYFWQWYVTNFAHPAVKDHVLNVIHHKFVSLPWIKFRPSMQDVELMLKVAEQYLPECHTFLGHIFLEIQWSAWLTNVAMNATAPIKMRIYHCLLSLIIKLCNEPNVRKYAEVKALQLVHQAEHFEWQLLETQSVQQAMDWYILSCDPIVILKTDHDNLDVSVLNLIRIICAYCQPYEGCDMQILNKRHIFVKTYVKLVSVFVSKHKAIILNKEKEMISVFSAQLEHLDMVVRTQQEMNVVLGELLTLLNQPGIKTALLKYFVELLKSKEGNCLMVKAILQSIGNYVVDVASVSLLYETAFDTYFCKNFSDMETTCWQNISPYLKPFIPKYNSLINAAIENGHLLTLHSLLLEKLARNESKDALLNMCITWFNNIKSNESNELKQPLLWSDFIKLTSAYVEENEAAAGEYLYKFAQYLFHLSEQKETLKWGGLLGVIGLGKQPVENLQFRFICRALSGYIMSQLPDAKGNPQKVRNYANAPGSVGQPGGNSDVPRVLLKMDFGQNQGKIKENAEKVLKQIQDPDNSFHNANNFLRDLLLFATGKPSYLTDL